MESKRHSAGGNSYELKYRNTEKPKDSSFVEERPQLEFCNDQGINASGRAQCLRQFHLVLDSENTNTLNVSIGGLVNSRNEMKVVRSPKIYKLRRSARWR